MTSRNGHLGRLRIARATLARMCEEGMTTTEIAAQTGVSYQDAWFHLLEFKLSARRGGADGQRRRFAAAGVYERHSEICGRLVAGESCAEIGRAHGITGEMVRQIAAAGGLVPSELPGFRKGLGVRRKGQTP